MHRSGAFCCTGDCSRNWLWWSCKVAGVERLASQRLRLHCAGECRKIFCYDLLPAKKPQPEVPAEVFA